MARIGRPSAFAKVRSLEQSPAARLRPPMKDGHWRGCRRAPSSITPDMAFPEDCRSPRLSARHPGHDERRPSDAFHHVGIRARIAMPCPLRRPAPSAPGPNNRAALRRQLLAAPKIGHAEKFYRPRRPNPAGPARFRERRQMAREDIAAIGQPHKAPALLRPARLWHSSAACRAHPSSHRARAATASKARGTRWVGAAE